MNSGHIILNGNKKIMFSAPHAVEQTRDGKIKTAEKETGKIAIILNKLGYPCIIKTKNIDDDANFDLNSQYKNDLVTFIIKNNIHAVVDLHQLSPMREQVICLGTGDENCSNLLGANDKAKKLQQYFAKYFNNVSINEPFSASSEKTISRYVSKKCNIPCIQIEINSKLFLDKIITVEDIAKIFDNATYLMEDFCDEENIIN